ncbi:hypothetical protein F4811DRAFT_421256 [Daldinia bambusicola]|nr:hypothetical protein F4811DRAFT_421256 [Daldinia bambusicola]
MHLFSTMLRLPPSLLVLLATATQLHAQQQQHPTAIRKMSLDEGEMFLPEYYAFAPSQLQPRNQEQEEELLLAGNSSATVPFRPPYPLHYDYLGRRAGAGIAGEVVGGKEEGKENSGPSPYSQARDVLAKLQGRQFACPEGTHSCANIDQPNYCCSQGTQCFAVTNAPDAGNVGCCPDGQTCGVAVGQCSDGSTACPANQGGGCCIEGFVCADVGCVHSTVSVITPTAAPSSTVSTSSTSTSSPPSTTATGGIPPYRPTSGSSITTTTTTTPPPTSSPSPPSSYCPTGFYACLAHSPGGCCRTGRDCSTTSCPPPPAMTTIVSDGATIAVPASDAQEATAAAAPPTGTATTCAEGWFLCGADAGPVAGCCPDGYSCGTASCTLQASAATATVQKELPSGAAGGYGRRRGRGVVDGVVVAWVLGVAVLVLI